MTTSDPCHLFGQASEVWAKQFLRGKGYRTLERNLRTTLGELDLVAEEAEVVVCVEVKGRTTEGFGGMLLAVDRRKQAKHVRLALQHLTERHLSDMPCRFDVVLVQGQPSAQG